MSLHEIRARAMQSGLMFDAPVVATTDLDYWHRCVTGYNRRYLQQIIPPPKGLPEPIEFKAQTETARCYPVLALDRLMSHPKWLKRQDREWILGNGQSEDWVTWNAFTLLTVSPDSGWWERLLFLAAESNSNLLVPNEWLEIPEVRLWQTIPPPRAYEAANRARMRCSGNREWMLRTENPAPVEGKSEIDVVFQNSHLLVFAEAKLGSDISLRTTYDLSRNQIVRNIDCLLDNSKGRTPLFLMLVRDAAESRAYTQLVARYRLDPRVLVRELPHHDPEMVASVARNLAIICWKDLLVECIGGDTLDDKETSAVKKELRRRVQGEAK